MGEPVDRAQDAGDSFDALLREVARLSDGPVDERRDVLPLGSRLAAGRFELLRRIGRGANGIVYAAYDTLRKQQVALKLLSTTDASGIYRIKNEFRALAEVRHPCLVRLHELFVDDQTWFFTMELVDGQPFDRFVRGKLRAGCALDEDAEHRLRLALAQLIAGVGAVHAAGKLHRDLKPSNVLVTAEGALRVLDFGLAADPDPGGVGQTLADERGAGTPAYMSPEQAAANPATQASDWYAVGTMLFEALTGYLPFNGHRGEMLAAKQRDRAPRPSALITAQPRDLEALCMQLLERDQAARPPGSLIACRLSTTNTSFASMEMGASRRGGAEPLLGRDAELRALRAAFEASSTSDRPVVVMLTGESGIGKTALLARLNEDLQAECSAVVLPGRCFERETVPFNAFDAVVDCLCRHIRRLSNEDTAVLVPRDAWALLRLFPVLGRLDVFAEAPIRHGVDAQEVRRRGFVALGQLLGAIRDRVPLVLQVDDLQWIDAESIALLTHLLRQPDAPNLLFVGSHRNGEYPTLEKLYGKLAEDKRIDFRRIVLGPLDSVHSIMLAGPEVPDGAVQQARGNPFLLRTLEEFARRRPSEGSISLELALTARCTELPAAPSRLLQAVALCAGPIRMDTALLAADADHAAFDALCDRGLVRTATGDEIECYHDRIRATVSAAVSRDQARQLHRSLARQLERTVDPNPEHLVLHLEGSGETDRAAEIAAAAAQSAARSLGFERAVRLFDKALQLGKFESGTRQSLLVGRADALALAGRSIEAAKACARALMTATPAEGAGLALRAGSYYLQSGYLDQGLALVNRGLSSYGLQIPTTQFGVIAALLWEQARLRARGFAPGRQAPSERQADQIAASELVAWSLGSVDPLRLAYFGTRATRLVLDTGDSVAIARAMAAYPYVAYMLGFSEREQEALLQRARQRCNEAGDAVATAMLEFVESAITVLFHPHRALKHMDRALALLSESPTPATAHVASRIGANRLLALGAIGRYREIAEQVPALIDDALARGNAAVLPLIAGGPAARARIAVGDVEGLRRDLQLARRHWPGGRMTWQELMLAEGEGTLAIAEGRTRDACLQAQEMERWLRQSVARYSVLTRRWLSLSVGVVHIAHAMAFEEGERRVALLRTAQASILAVRGAPGFLSTHARTMLAAITAAQGRPEDAVRELRIMVNEHRLDQAAPGYLTIARYALGRLQGGEEGARLVMEADAELRMAGVDESERFLAVVAPGFQ